MATALQQLGQLAESILQTGDAVIDTIGGNVRAQAQQNQNTVDAQTARIQMEVLAQKAKLEQSQENQKLLRTVIYGAMALIACILIFKGVLSLIKK